MTAKRVLQRGPGRRSPLRQRQRQRPATGSSARAAPPPAAGRRARPARHRRRAGSAASPRGRRTAGVAGAPPRRRDGRGRRGAVSSGVSTTTSRTRRYCMNATSRSSPPRSRVMRDDSGGAAGDHPQRGARAVEAGRPREHGAGQQADRERGGAHERDRQPVAGHRRQRGGLQVGADRDADDRLRGDETAGSGMASRPGRHSAIARPTSMAANSARGRQPDRIEADGGRSGRGAERQPGDRRAHVTRG